MRKIFEYGVVFLVLLLAKTSFADNNSLQVWELENSQTNFNVIIAPTGNDYLAWQYFVVDENLNVLYDNNGQLLSNNVGGMLISKERINDMFKSLKYKSVIAEIGSKVGLDNNSCKADVMAGKNIRVSDNNFIKWVKLEAFKDEYSMLNNLYCHNSDLPCWKDIPILQKTNKDGVVIFNKLYLYRNSWIKKARSEQDDEYYFNHFAPTCISIVGNDTIISFNGTKKIFRVDEYGNYHTNDHNLKSISLEEFSRNMKYSLAYINKKKLERPIFLTNRYENNTFQNYYDYDYLGEYMLYKYYAVRYEDIDWSYLKGKWNSESIRACIKKYH
jgi:hypothetical protein